MAIRFNITFKFGNFIPKGFLEIDKIIVKTVVKYGLRLYAHFSLSRNVTFLGLSSYHSWKVTLSKIHGQARSSFHQGVLESVYIKTQNSVLCR